MAKLEAYIDGRAGCWSRLRTDDGQPIFISIAQTGIIIKRTRFGIFGALLFEERNIYKCARIAQEIDIQHGAADVPLGIKNPVLRAFTQMALDAGSIASFTQRINQMASLVQEIDALKARDAATNG